MVGGVHRESGGHRNASLVPAHSSQDSDSERPTKVSTKSSKHSIFTHFPKDLNCEVCLRNKITRALCRRRNGETVPRAEKLGDLITADHKEVHNEKGESRNNHRYAVVVQHLATQRIQSYPCKTKSSHETERSLPKFLEPSHRSKVVYTGNSMEFGTACEDLSWNHRTSTRHRSETNGIAERVVRRVKGVTSAVLLQSPDEKILWYAGAIFEKSKTWWVMGKHHLEDDLENHSKDQQYRSGD